MCNGSIFLLLITLSFTADKNMFGLIAHKVVYCCLNLLEVLKKPYHAAILSFKLDKDSSSR